MGQPPSIHLSFLPFFHFFHCVSTVCALTKSCPWDFLIHTHLHHQFIFFLSSPQHMPFMHTGWGSKPGHFSCQGRKRRWRRSHFNAKPESPTRKNKALQEWVSMKPNRMESIPVFKPLIWVIQPSRISLWSFTYFSVFMWTTWSQICEEKNT